MSRIAAGGTARNYPCDAKKTPLPLSPIAAARQRGLPRLRESGLSARVAGRLRGPCRPKRDDRRPGAGNRRGGRAPPLAWPRRPDASPLARHGRGTVLLDLLLLVRHALLSR